MTEKLPRHMDDAARAIFALRNGLKPDEMDFTYSGPNIATLTTGASTEFSIPTYSDSYFVVKKFLMTGSESAVNFPLTVKITNNATGRTLMNAPINALSIFGGVQALNIIKDPVVLPPSSSLSFVFTNTGGDTLENLQVSLWGYRAFDLTRWPVEYKAGSRLEWFQLALGPLGLVGGTGQRQYVGRVDADADFLVRKIVGGSINPGDNFIGNLQISDSDSTDAWEEKSIGSNVLIGSANSPSWLVKPRLLPRNSIVNLFTNAIVTNPAQVVLEGAKVYRGY